MKRILVLYATSCKKYHNMTFDEAMIKRKEKRCSLNKLISYVANGIS